MVKPTNSQQVESQTANRILQKVESDAISSSLEISVSFEVTPSVIQGDDQVTEQDVNNDENKDRLWVMSNNPLQLEERKKISRKPSWLITNMIVAYALPVVEETILSTYRELKSVRSPRCGRMP